MPLERRLETGAPMRVRTPKIGDIYLDKTSDAVIMVSDIRENICGHNKSRDLVEDVECEGCFGSVLFYVLSTKRGGWWDRPNNCEVDWCHKDQSFWERHVVLVKGKKF